MELISKYLYIELSRAARAELIRKMQRTGGDPSNRKALVVYDPANPSRLKVGIVEESAAKKGQVVAVSDIDLLFGPGEAESFNGGTIQFETSAENVGIWSVSYTKAGESVVAGIGRGVAAGAAEGLRESVAKYGFIVLAFANLVAVFGLVRSLGFSRNWLEAFGAALAVGAVALTPVELLLLPGLAPGSFSYWRRLARKWWFYAGTAAIVGFAIWVGTWNYRSEADQQRQVDYDNQQVQSRMEASRKFNEAMNPPQKKPD